MSSAPPPVIIKPKGQHTATLIFLHGLGDTGHGWAEEMDDIVPDYVKVVCPTANSMPVTGNSGMVMPAWYDIRHFEQGNDDSREDLEACDASSEMLMRLIEKEANELPNGKESRIMIGGFSQGGAIALNTLLRSKDKLAGCAALSTYIPGISMLLKCNSFVIRVKWREDILKF